MKTPKYIEPTKWLEEKPNFHFYASSVATWRTNENIEQLIKDMKREKYPFEVYYVPLPSDAEYQINWYVPQVEGIMRLAHYGDPKRFA